MLSVRVRSWVNTFVSDPLHNITATFIIFKCLWYIGLSLLMKWNESGFRPPLCTYRLNWARRTSWGWWDDWDDTVLQTQDSKFEPWRSEAEHATSRSRRLPTILTFTRGWGRNNFVSFKPPRPGTEPRTLAWKAAVLTTTLGPPPLSLLIYTYIYIYSMVSLWLVLRHKIILKWTVICSNVIFCWNSMLDLKEMAADCKTN